MRQDFTLKMMQAMELLERPQGAGIKEIARHCQISERSVYRLLSSMEDHNISLFDEPDPDAPTNQKRWKVLNAQNKTNQYQKLISLDNKERMLLSIALKRIQVLDSDILSQRLKNIQEKLAHKNIISVKENDTSFLSAMKRKKDYSGKEEMLDVILEAIEKKTSCSVTYKAAYTGKTKKYTVNPYTLMEYSGGLYVICCISRYESIRLLAVDRILTIEPLNASFTIPENYNPDSLFSNSFGLIRDEPEKFVLKFSKKSALYIKERIFIENQTIEENDDGSLTLRFLAGGRNEIMSWILSFGSDAEVIEPEDFRKAVENEITKMGNMYKTS